MSKARVYIAGPMTGIKEMNRPAFREAADVLAKLGYEPVTTIDMPDGYAYTTYICESMHRLETCDAMVLLPGWRKSRGVMDYERSFAIENSIPQYEYADFVKARPML